jgi:mono/diheme cytochrome c family protein
MLPDRKTARDGPQCIKSGPNVSIKSMNDLSPLKPRLLAVLGLAFIAAAIYVVQVPIVCAGPPAAPEKPALSNSISGATLYATHCSRCHQERYPTEFNLAQWQTIMIHMRVRANLPADQAREVLKYLQENAGN